jgi:hypothetical protein
VSPRAAADGDKKSVDRERLLLPCLPPPAVRVTVTCNSKKNTHKAISFSCSSFFCAALFFSVLGQIRSFLFLS